MYQIEKDIPIPPLRESVPKEPVYPIAELEVGDSFFVPVEGHNLYGYDNETSKVRGRIYNEYVKHRDSSPDHWHKKITIRKVEGGVRVWRLV